MTGRKGKKDQSERWECRSCHRYMLIAFKDFNGPADTDPLISSGCTLDLLDFFGLSRSLGGVEVDRQDFREAFDCALSA